MKLSAESGNLSPPLSDKGVKWKLKFFHRGQQEEALIKSIKSKVLLSNIENWHNIQRMHSAPEFSGEIFQLFGMVMENIFERSPKT